MNHLSLYFFSPPEYDNPDSSASRTHLEYDSLLLQVEDLSTLIGGVQKRAKPLSGFLV
jgi:hypothetical protein